MLQHELRIAGSGPLYGKLKAKYDSWPQITFLGQLDNGLTFASGDSKALAAAIDAAVYGPWNHEQIRRDAISRFNPKTYYARLLSIYKSIL